MEANNARIPYEDSKWTQGTWGNADNMNWQQFQPVGERAEMLREGEKANG